MNPYVIPLLEKEPEVNIIESFTCPTKKIHIYLNDLFIYIEKKVCNQLDVNINFINRTRERENITAKHLIWFFLNEKNKGYSLQKLGNLYGKDHATVLSALRKIRNWIETDREFALMVNKLRKEIG